MKESSKKIICTVTNDLTYDQRMIRICSSLTAMGYEVLLLGRVMPGSLALQPQTFKQKRLRCWLHSGKLFYLEFNLRLFWFLLWHPFHFIYSVDLDSLCPGYLAGLLKGKVCIYDAHEYFTEVPEVVDRPFTKWVWGRIAGWIIPRLKYAYTVGPCLADLFQEQYNIPFGLIRNLPRLQEEKVNIPEEGQDKIILYQGRLNEGRGIETAIMAMHQLQDTQLWLAGEGDLSQVLKALVERENLSAKVNFLGYIQPEALKKITLKAHIGLNLLENKGLSYYYSLANKAFDYIQAGLPSVQMSFPEYRALQDQFQVFSLLEQLDVDHVVRILQQLLEDREYWLRLHQNCLKARNELNWEKEEKKLRTFFDSIV